MWPASNPGVWCEVSRVLVALAVLLVSSMRAELSAEELARVDQNRVGHLFGMPFQNDTNFT